MDDHGRRRPLIGVKFTPHALERLREHYPWATPGDAALAVGQGEEIDVQLAWALTSRKSLTDEYARYILHPSDSGLFIVRSDPRGGHTVITYLRFGSEQRRIAGLRTRAAA